MILRLAMAAVAGIVVAALAGSAPLVLAAAAALLLILFVAYVRRRLFEHLTYERELSTRVVTWGGEVTVTSVVENRKWLPVIWLQVSDEWPLAVEPLDRRGTTTSRRTQRIVQTMTVAWFERVRRRRVVRCEERGAWTFGPAELEASDPFGLGGLATMTTATDELVVLPKVLAVPEIDLVYGRPLVGAPVMRSLARDPAALAGVRAYRVGEPLHAVNWRATARTRELMANDWDPTSAAEVRMLLDTRVHEFAWEGTGADTVELLCSVCASLAARLCDLGFAVGLRSNAYMRRTWRELDTDPSTGTLPEILDSLARVVVVPPLPFDGLLRDELARAAGGCEYLVVTGGIHGHEAALLAALGREAPLRVLYVGRPPAAAAHLVDWRLDDDFDWRGSDVLPLG